MIIRCSFIICLLVLVNASVFGQKRDTCCSEEIEFIDQETPVRASRGTSPYDSLLSNFSEKDRNNFKLIMRSGDYIMTDSVFSKIPPVILENSILENLTLLVKSKKVLFSNFYKIKKLKYLQYLDIKNDSLETLPPEISELKTLKRVDITCQAKITNFNVEGLEKLPSLKELWVHASPSTPKGIEKIITLQKIYLVTEGKQDTLSLNLNKLINLEELTLISSCNNFLLAKNSTSKIKKIEIYLSNIKKIPDEVFQIKSLEELYIDCFSLNNSPNLFQNLIKLNTLFISTNQSLNIPKELSKLPNLKKLALNVNNCSLDKDVIFSYIKELEYGKSYCLNLEQFPNIESIALSGVKNNQDSTIPDLRKLKNLKYLKIETSTIDTLPDYIFTDLKNLKEINIRGAHSTLVKKRKSLQEKYPHLVIR
jgi:Leucine-rich repeat (LRR) protein